MRTSFFKQTAALLMAVAMGVLWLVNDLAQFGFAQTKGAEKTTAELFKKKMTASNKDEAFSALQLARSGILGQGKSAIPSNGKGLQIYSDGQVLAQTDSSENRLPGDYFYGTETTLPPNKVIKGGLTATSDEIDITRGKARIINLKNPASRVAISDPATVSVLVISPTQIQLIGNQVGVANLLIWDGVHDDKYAILDINVHRDVSVLARQIRLIDPNIQVLPMAADDSVILTGITDTREQAQMAVEIAKAYFSGSSQGGGGLSTGGGSSARGGGASSSSSSSGAGSASSGGASGSSGSSSSSNSGTNSLAPGSNTPGPTPNIINLIQIKGQPSTKAEAVRRKLHDVDPSIQMDVVPGSDGVEKVILTGMVKSADTVSQAINIAAVFYGQPGLRVVTGPGGNAIRTDVGSTDFQDALSFNTNMDINILQGSVISDASGNVVSMMKVAYRPQVVCKVKILDVNRTALKQVGHNFLSNMNDFTVGHFSGSRAPAAGANIASLDPEDTGSFVLETGDETRRRGVVQFAAGVNPIFGDGVTQFFTLDQKYALALSALVERRKARTLAEPVLTVLSGEKASFLAGGEIPIPVTGTNGQISIEFHEFGIRLNLIATVKDDGKIHLQVAPEVSSVDSANSITTNTVTVPAFATRRFQTTVELKDGQSFVMAGLFNQEETESASKFPGIGSLPIIGSFFRNKFTDRRDREMVVIIQPETMMAHYETPQTAAPQSSSSKTNAK